ncbi:MAG: hypothetical protein CK520_01180 [Actinobacteria bacterium]|uniref:Unannotated protein n=1 Tax=freshwater metagenome TaxID=449393 RepID=A0A6J7M4J6_9ZZZZ|nr:hypothetical protein [Acidimicrobiia bacterium]MCX6505235.1 hypothetical protein [Actinomycetota bacterium]GDX29648.1 hypothetical protein LBMAG14_01240 [Actinomycetes bacterium]MSO18389.1 hypothetical protein [Acidimicrobiia bacterium]MSV40417.1 hypothetical protein [Actinomycetota bacterium]
MSTSAFVLGEITPRPTEQEARVIEMAMGEIVRSGGFSLRSDEVNDMAHQWVTAARLSARGGGRRRGPWRLNERSGRN